MTISEAFLRKLHGLTKILCLDLTEGLEENHEKCQSGRRMFRPGFQLGPSGVGVSGGLRTSQAPGRIDEQIWYFGA